MASEEDKKGAHAPTGEPLPPSDNNTSEAGHAEPAQEHPSPSHAATDPEPAAPTVSYTPTVDDQYGSYDDPYGYDVHSSSAAEVVPPVQVAVPPPSQPPPPPKEEEHEDEDDDGMLRMSFLGHLEDLRKRLLY